MQAMTEHAMARAVERLTPAERATVAARCAALARTFPSGSVAVRVLRLSAMRGDREHGSNGSDVWAVVRFGRVRTLMLRRATQPTTPDAFNVERVLVGA